MKQKIKNLLAEAVIKAHENNELPSDQIPEIEIEEPKMNTHGDFSTNIAMQMAKIQKMAPRKIAESILKHLGENINSSDFINKTEIAGPGFINIFLKPAAWYPVLKEIQEKNDQYGASDLGRGTKFQIEFVSSNPTGPLHVGHGRGAAIGDTVGNILSFCGYDVQKEYYINDAGTQIRTLGLSVYLRYKELSGQEIDFPDTCYQGDYIRDIAEMLKGEKKDSLSNMDEEEILSFCAKYAIKFIIKGIEEDLELFKVKFDSWFSEQSLYDSGNVEACISELRKRDIIYEKDEASWFRTTDFGDDQDRVVVRNNGETTYFASDIAYHVNKFKRGFDRLVDVWGADHHGYIPRMKASVEASGYDREKLEVILVQLVNLLRDGKPVQMSTRAGEFVTLKDVVDEVGSDAARFIFLTRHHNSPLDFDLEVAKKKTNDNPVFYVQYVHARISSIAKKGLDNNILPAAPGDKAEERLVEPEDLHLMKTMARYPEVVKNSAMFMEPHRITFFLQELATAFHSYYNRHKVIGEDIELSSARLLLVLSVKKVIKNGLNLLGVSAPDKM